MLHNTAIRITRQLQSSRSIILIVLGITVRISNRRSSDQWRECVGSHLCSGRQMAKLIYTHTIDIDFQRRASIRYSNIFPAAARYTRRYSVDPYYTSATVALYPAGYDVAPGRARRLGYGIWIISDQIIF